MSKWYYSFTVEKTSNYVISLHQDDDRFKEELSKRQTMDISLTILKKDAKSKEIQIVETIDFAISANIQLELNLSPGEYIILPRVAGCFFGRPFDKGISKRVALLDDIDKTITPELKDAIRDVFRKYDVLLQKELRYNDFKAFWSIVGNSEINEAYFREEILEKNISSDNGLTEKGFINLWEETLRKKGQKTIWEWLFNLGYDEELYPIRSRCFMLTIHSEKKTSVAVRHTLDTELNYKVNKMILESKGSKKVMRDENGNELVIYENPSQ